MNSKVKAGIADILGILINGHTNYFNDKNQEGELKWKGKRGNQVEFDWHNILT